MHSLTQRWRAAAGYREFLLLAFPLILSTSAWSIQHFVDRMFLSWYSPEALAAALPANFLNLALMTLFMGTATYTGTFVAQYYGAGRPHRVGPAVWQGLYVSLLGSLVVMAFIPLAGPIFTGIGHDPVVRDLEVDYFQILCWGGFFPIASSALSGFFAGLSRPWPVMWINALATLVNVVFDYAMIFGNWGFPEMGIKGAGWATVMAGATAFILFLALFLRRSPDRQFHTVKGWRPDNALFWRLVKFGLPAGVQFFMDIVAITVFVLVIGRLGVIELAATNIALNVNMLTFLPMIGAGIAVTVMVGQHLGGDQSKLAEKAAYSGFHLTFAYMAVMAAGFVLIPGLFIAPFAAQADPARYAEIFRLARNLMVIIAVYAVFDSMSIIFSSALKGAGDTRFVMVLFGLAACGILIGPAWFMVTVLNMGVFACWAALAAYAVFLGVVFWIRFRGGRWKKMRVIEARPPLAAEEIV